MAFSKFRTLFPTIIFILVCVLISMIVLNFFHVNMNDNNGFKVLNRTLTVEGFKEDATMSMHEEAAKALKKELKNSNLNKD